MFGSSSTPFGSPPANTGFGGGSNTAPVFGAPSPAPFGAPAPSAFGGTGGFGSPAPAPSGFGGFGAPAPSTGFGTSNTGGFGSTNTGGFGAPAPSSGFGVSNTSPFGAPAPAPSGGLFGSTPAPATGGLFGAAPQPAAGGFGSSFGGTTGGFGSTNTSTGFGTQTSTFGAPAPAPGGLFGSSTSTTPAFGAPSTTGFGGTTTSTFGSPAPAPGGSLFGAPAPAPGLFGAATTPTGSQQGGTRIAPFQVTTRQDGTNSISLQSITAMPQYESKSFDELRVEDYAQGNKGGATPGASGGAFGTFGAPTPAPSGGLFGSPAPAPAAFGSPAPAPFGTPSTGGLFGAPAPSAFGAPAPAPFGAPAPGAFGSPAPAPFGAPAPASTFGSTFGAPKPATGGGLFGSSAPAPGGLFGSSPAPAPAFGASAPSGGLFGSAPAPATGGLFGSAPAPATGGLFGSTTPSPAPAFGSQAPAPGGLFGGGFGSSATTTGFGASNPAPAFGAPATGGIFGSTTPTSGGLFGAKPAGSFFGSPSPAPTGGLFGAPPASGGGLFSSTTPTASGVPGMSPIGSIMPPARDEILAQQLASIEKTQKELEKYGAWTDQGKETAGSIPASLSDADPLVRLPSRSLYSPYNSRPKSTSKIRPRGFDSLRSPATESLSALASGGGGTMMSPAAFARSSALRLVVDPKAHTPQPKIRLRLEDTPAEESKTTASPQIVEEITSPPAEQQMTSPTGQSAEEVGVSTPTEANTQASTAGAPGGSAHKDSPGYDYYQQVIAAPDAAAGVASPSPSKKEAPAPKLTKDGYTVVPSMEELQAMSEAELATVSEFSVSREGYGSIEWEGAVDVRDADLDDIVSIERNEVTVYLRDEEEGTKPPRGSKLNRPAIITFSEVFPKRGGREADAATMDAFESKLQKNCEKMGTDFISYDKTNGEWKFRVHHFSRYGLDDDSDEEEPNTAMDADYSASNENMDTNMDQPHVPTKLKGILKKPSVPVRNSRFVVDDDTSDNMEGDEVRISDEHNTEEAELAYNKIYSSLIAEPAADAEMEVEDKVISDSLFPDEGEPFPRGSAVPRSQAPSMEDLHNAMSGESTCAKMAQKSLLSIGKTSSSIDYGQRMGRSFRVGWCPDGSFLCINQAGKEGSPTVIRRRPVFSRPESSNVSEACLKAHLASASRTIVHRGDSGVPQFSLPPAVSNAGTSNSHQGLSDAFEKLSASVQGEELSMAAGEKERAVVWQAFALLASILCNDSIIGPGVMQDGAVPFERVALERQVEAVSRWLSNACRRQVDREIAIALSRNDSHSAIFAAMTGGDMEKASRVASEAGYFHLAALLSSGPEGRKDVSAQLHSWHDSGALSKMDRGLKRIYTMASGNLEMEEAIFKQGGRSLDWRRRLLMLLEGRTHSLLESIRTYEGSVMAGVAPAPSPWYILANPRAGATAQCLLFRMLRAITHPDDTSLCEVVDPSGYTELAHDYSLSFHVAAGLSAVGGTSQLTNVEEEKLIDSYVSQLACEGQWHWAAYVSLCSFGAHTAGWKLNRAKQFVLRNYTKDGHMCAARRAFLENDVGLPSAWFEEALALRCALDGDAYGYVDHVLAVEPAEALQTFSQTLLPNILFMDKKDIEGSMKILEEFGVGDPLAQALFHFFLVVQELKLLASASPEDIATSVPALLERCAVVEQTFRSCREHSDHHQGIPTLRVVPHYRLVGMAPFLVDVMSSLSLVQLLLKALLAGVRISDDMTENTKNASQLAFMTSIAGAREMDGAHTSAARDEGIWSLCS